MTKLHFKPTYDFQTVEFDFDMENKGDLDGAFELYAELIKRLKEVAPEQPSNKPKPKNVVKNVVKKPFKPLATQKQKDILDKYGIEYTDDITCEEASKLIKLSMGR